MTKTPVRHKLYYTDILWTSQTQAILYRYFVDQSDTSYTIQIFCGQYKYNIADQFH